MATVSPIILANVPFQSQGQITRLDGYMNTPPENQEAITQDAFIRKLVAWAWPYYEWRYDPQTCERFSIWRHHDGSGIGVAHNASGTRYFTTTLCQHQWEVTRTANCYREYTCSICGAKNAVDSSG